MPIYDITCRDCGFRGEALTTGPSANPTCPQCGGENTDKHMAPTSSLTGKSGSGLPGPGDTTCCGSSPGGSGCAGPGSCCGRG